MSDGNISPPLTIEQGVANHYRIIKSNNEYARRQAMANANWKDEWGTEWWDEELFGEKTAVEFRVPESEPNDDWFFTCPCL